MGNTSQGTVLSNQVQGVKQGAGVLISADGTISFDSSTVSGVVRLNNAAAYNNYVWPGSLGTSGQVLQGDGLGNLSWVSVSASAGLGLTVDGTNLKVSIPTASTPPVIGGGVAQAVVGSLYWDDILNQLFIYYTNGGTPVWVQAAPAATASGGGGSGTVTSVNLSGGTTGFTTSGGPITASGTITLAGTLNVANGGTGATTAAAAMVNLLPAQAGNSGKVLATDGLGVLSWATVGGTGTVTSVTGTAPIVVATGTTTPAISITDASTTAKGAIQLATAAENAAGTDATKAVTPEFSVPKDASGMTGAALLPTGTQLQRPATPVAGMLRMNTTLSPDSLEVYDGTAAAWKQIAYVPPAPTAPPDLTISANGALPSGTYNNVTINAGVTATVSGLVYIKALGAVTINGSINGAARGTKAPSLGFGNGSASSLTIVGQAGHGNGSGEPCYSANSTTTPQGGTSYSFLSYQSSSGAAASVQVQGSSNALGQTGGAGGASLVVEAAGAISVSGSSNLDFAGGSASVGTLSAGGQLPGNGGGSGGLILLQSDTSISIAAGATLNVSGGNGSTFVSSFTSAKGGGGGGGGYVVLNTPSLSNSGTVTLTGGLAGANGTTTGVDWTAGAGGAGWGGAGGQGGFDTGAPANGGNGQLLLNNYI